VPPAVLEAINRLNAQLIATNRPPFAIPTALAQGAPLAHRVEVQQTATRTVIRDLTTGRLVRFPPGSPQTAPIPTATRIPTAQLIPTATVVPSQPQSTRTPEGYLLIQLLRNLAGISTIGLLTRESHGPGGSFPQGFRSLTKEERAQDAAALADLIAETQNRLDRVAIAEFLEQLRVELELSADEQTELLALPLPTGPARDC
jgi:hypothetical protein